MIMTTTEKKGKNVYVFCDQMQLFNSPFTPLYFVRADSLEEAISLHRQKHNSDYISILGGVDLNIVQRDLGLQTTQLIIQENKEDAKPTLDQLAKLLRDKGYTVHKKRKKYD